MEKLDNRMDNVIGDHFKDYIAKGLFKFDFIAGKREYYIHGRCHSRVLGIITQSIQSMGYITDIQRKVEFKEPYRPTEKHQDQRIFTPDITVVNKEDKIVGIIEYESIDAPDWTHFKKIEYFKKAIPANNDLQFIIFFPTLTTLSERPARWIKLERQEYIGPLVKKLQELSSAFPTIEIIFLILDENGFSSKIIKQGNIEDRGTENIWGTPNKK